MVLTTFLSAPDPMGSLAALDPILEPFVQGLEDEGVRYWLEAGSLLALVREGRFFTGDKDLDIGVWADDLDRLGVVLEGQRRAGRRVARESWKGQPFKYKVYPKNDEKGRVLDIQIYRPTERQAWSVVHTVGDYDYRWYSFLLVARGAVRWPFRMWLAHHATEVEVTAFPWNRMGWLGTWIYPLELVETTTRKNPFSLRFPDPPEKYLDYRYGDWSRPRPDWVYWKHDGAYHLGPPDDHLPV